MMGQILSGDIGDIGLGRWVTFLNVYAQYIFRHQSVEPLLKMEQTRGILSSVDVKLEMCEDAEYD